MIQNNENGSKDNGDATEPLLPRRWDSLFDNEAGSDVIFLVGPESENWRFPGHKRILSGANPVFRAMLQGPLADSEPMVAINDVDGRAFDHLMRFLYREDVEFRTVGTALSTLYAAQKYLCAGLTRKCITYLDNHLTKETVLQIYQHIRFYCDGTRDNIRNERTDLGLWIPSAPTAESLDNYSVNVDADPNDNSDMMTCLCCYLHHNCLQYIEANANEVLAEESVEDLTRDALLEIARRDGLAISSETILFSALERWSNRECKRTHRELTPENIRSILGDDLILSVRYLSMSSEEFLSGPMQSGLLDQIETTVILAHILKSPVSSFAATLTPEVLNYMKRPRIRSFGVPIVLSHRSAEAEKVKSKNLTKLKKSEKKNKQKKQKRKELPGSPEKKCSSCFFEYMLAGLACLFD